MLSAPEQLTDRRIGWRCQRAALLLVELSPLSLVAGLEQGARTIGHASILPWPLPRRRTPPPKRQILQMRAVPVDHQPKHHPKGPVGRR
jgi:hypothetical protein